MFPAPDINAQSDVPLYRQVFQQLKDSIHCGKLCNGAKLPATRELAGMLGLNRTTVSAAYELLETEGLVSGQVGRGSFVTGGTTGRVDWSSMLERGDGAHATPGNWSRDVISFAVARPSRELFPLDDFRTSTEAVLARADL